MINVKRLKISRLLFSMLFFSGLLTCFFGCVSKKELSKNLYLIRNGKSYSEIIIAKEASAFVKLAAKELNIHLEKMTGSLLPINTKISNGNLNCILIGQTEYYKPTSQEKKVIAQGGFIVKTENNKLILLGDDTQYVPKKPYAISRAENKSVINAFDNMTGHKWGTYYTAAFKAYNRKLDIWEFDKRGSLNAVYHFLKGLGLRWYLPGEIGEVLPEVEDIRFDNLDITIVPDFKVRNLSFYSRRFFAASEDDLLYGLRLGANTEAEIAGFGPIGHGMQYLHSRDEFKKKYPQAYALFEGKRDTNTRINGKPCLSSDILMKEHIEYVKFLFDHYNESLVSVMPTDAYVACCTCRKCIGRNTPERGFEGQISDYVWNYVNTLAKELYKTHPNKKVSCFAYGAYLLPPEKIKKLSPNIIIGICRTRKDFSSDKTKSFYNNILTNWEQLTTNKLLLWDYYLHARPEKKFAYTPILFPTIIQEDLKYLNGRVHGEFIEIYRAFNAENPLLDLAINHINVYLTSELYFDSSKNVDELLNEYCQNFYGEAGPEMKKFIKLAEAQMDNLVNNKENLKILLEIISNAERKVDDLKQLKRIRLIKEFIQNNPTL